ncbi:probable aspartic proteinase GIP2 [Telopea speciosissima]|uniref:probable aspartic proteinase GIP2 n=1 Tax=Telopea speciosissima TaxID=54955 RepID=UPI001CC73534|nr:probable aspartic proteinase GIP2 [Telopea speciosissima]
MATTATTTPTLQTLFFFFLLSLFTLSEARRESAAPDSLPLPIWKDESTLQYITHHIAQGTPPISLKLVLDVGGPFLWLDCHSTFVSQSYFPVRCRSIQCSAARTTGGGFCNCNNSNNNNKDDEICHLYPQNPISHKASAGELVEDILHFTYPSNASAHTRFLFSCAPNLLLSSLASGAQGMLGLGSNRISLPSQIAAVFDFHRKFAICLPPSSSQGVIFFGDGPYMLQSDMDASKYLMYTPLITANSNERRVAGPDPSADYFIGVKSITINGKSVQLNSSLLSIDGEGRGGTKISTAVPYTTIETSIFVAVTKSFSEAAINNFNMTRVAPVPPFQECFSSKNIVSARTGPVVPTIDLVLQSEMVYWRIWGSNSMVRVKEDVFCLAMLDGGWRPINSIVVGGYQLENNLLQFDLASSRLGFSSSLLTRQTTCSPSPGGSSYQR